MADKGNSYTKFARNAADLCAFMVVCRHGQLSAAAREMKVSQPSLSQRIRNLETALNQKLFERTSKGVSLTRDGAALYRNLYEPLTDLANRFHDVVDKHRQQRLLISVDYAFAYFWLLPRLPKIRDRLGEIDISVLTSQEPKATAISDADLVICMAEYNQVSPDDTLLIPEQVNVICSPEFRATHSEISTASDLKKLSQLLHLVTPLQSSSWCSWAEFLREFGVDASGLSRGTTFSNYEMIVKATLANQGAALGWKGLVDDLLQNGELVQLVPETYVTERGYYISNASQNPSQLVNDVRNWIVEEIALSS